MSNQPSNKKGTSINNQPGAGSEYHREHAGNVQGYGSNDVASDESSIKNSTGNSNQ